MASVQHGRCVRDTGIIDGINIKTKLYDDMYSFDGYRTRRMKRVENGSFDCPKVSVFLGCCHLIGLNSCLVGLTSIPCFFFVQALPADTGRK